MTFTLCVLRVCRMHASLVNFQKEQFLRTANKA